MELLSLSPRALLYLASQLGAQTFWGIPDPFRGLSKQELLETISALQIELEQKGLVSWGFDESVHIREDISRLISVCSGCEKYLTVGCVATGTETFSVKFYSAGGAVVAIEQNDAEAELLLRKVSESQCRELLKSMKFGGGDKVPLKQKTVDLPIHIFGGAKNMISAEAEALLISYGCSPAQAALIHMCLRGKGEYYSALLFDFVKKQFNNLSYMSAEDSGTLRITYMEDDPSHCSIAWVSESDLKQALDSMIKSLFSERGRPSDASL